MPSRPAPNVVKYVGYLAEGTGYGQAAREHLLAMSSAGVSVAARSILLGRGGPIDVPPDARAFPEVAGLTRAVDDHDTVVAHTPPEVFHLVREPEKRNIGVTAWETETLPADWTAPVRAMDELWVPSEFCARAFAAVSQRPVAVVPHPVTAPAPRERWLPGVPDDVFLFAAIFEWSDRKNPDGLVRAFRRAFSGRRDVGLLLKIGLRFGGDADVVHATLRKVLAPFPWRSPPIYVVAQTDTGPDVVAQIHARADAYVSLHRAEGFGLCMAEAMAAGKPVVATGYSGNLEFMDDESAFLVDYDRVPVRQRLSRLRFFEEGMEWAEPKLDHAVAQLRACVDEPARRRVIAERGRRRVLELLAPARIGALMRERVHGAGIGQRD